MKYLLISLAFLSLTALLTTSCKTSSGAQKQVNEMTITLSQGGCFGNCPIFTMSILPDGTANYIGKRYAPYKGEHLATPSSDSVNRVKALASDVLAKADILPREIKSNIADLPRSTITIKTTKDSVVFIGDAEFSPPVAKLRTALLNLASSTAWQRSPNAEPLPPNQLLVTLQAPDQVQVVTEDYFRQQLKVIRLVSKDPAVFLMSFDPYTMSAEEMVRDLKRKKMVQNVEIVENK